MEFLRAYKEQLDYAQCTLGTGVISTAELTVSPKVKIVSINRDDVDREYARVTDVMISDRCREVLIARTLKLLSGCEPGKTSTILIESGCCLMSSCPKLLYHKAILAVADRV